MAAEQDDQLPAPEGKRRQLVTDQSHMTGALHHIIGGRKQCGAAKGEDHRIGMQWAQAAEGQPGYVEVEHRPRQLGGDQNAHQHADDTPDNGHDGELPDHRIVIRLLIGHADLPDSEL